MNIEQTLTLLSEPHVSEKATVLAEKYKQFVFKVSKAACKASVKTAVEHLFGVKVKQVRVINVVGKKKQFRQIAGRRSDWKKAYVTLQPGQDIDFAVAE